MNAPKRLVVIGNGMAGARVVEEILQRDAEQFHITMFGAEPYGNYNRILLSNVLNGTQSAEQIFLNPLSWYAQHDITLARRREGAAHRSRAQVVIGRPLPPAALPYGADARRRRRRPPSRCPTIR